jgi:hypothetical protein
MQELTQDHQYTSVGINERGLDARGRALHPQQRATLARANPERCPLVVKRGIHSSAALQRLPLPARRRARGSMRRLPCYVGVQRDAALVVPGESARHPRYGHFGIRLGAERL